MVLSDDKGLVADPVDLIDLQVTANIDGDGTKSARHEAALARMSSNGLSYIILVVILIGFVNRVRRKEKVVVPFVVDELKDLSVVNATALLNLLARNNITMISAFPDVDPALTLALTERMKADGAACMHAELAQVDPEYAARIHPNDRQRIVRALEVRQATGKPFTWWHKNAMSTPPCAGPLLVLDAPLAWLEPRLARRLGPLRFRRLPLLRALKAETLVADDSEIGRAHV